MFLRASNFLLILLLSLTVTWMLGCGSGSSPESSGTTGTTGTGGTGSTGNTGGSGGSSGNTGGSGATGGGGGSTTPTLVTEDVATGLAVPWELVFAPDGRMFFTEQRGRLRVIQNGTLQATPVFDITNVSSGGEAGLTGLEIDRNFSSNGYLYVFYCYNTGARCKVARLVVSGNSATENKTLIDFPAGNGHDGGRIKIGPDNLLYVAVGDFHNSANAQDLSSMGGKILRMQLDGTAAGSGFAGNLYAYSIGHRDPQGLMFDSSGQLYETEHGETSNDEVNIIMAGKNYGWPTCQGVCGNPSFVDPIKLWNPETAAPSGATFYYGSAIPQWNGSMLIGLLGLGNNTYAHHVHRIKLDAPGGTKIVEEEILYKDTYGRIRDVVAGPEGFVYVLTSNGSGDKIVRVKPQ